MGIGSFFHLVSWNLSVHLRKRHFLISIIMFLLIGISSVSYVLLYPTPLQKNVWDAILVAFSGPGLNSGSILDLLRWFIPQILFLYLFGDLSANEIEHGGLFLIPLIGSRKLWWMGQIATLLILSISFVFLGLVLISIFSVAFLPWSVVFSPFLRSELFFRLASNFHIPILLLWIGALYSSTLFAISLIQTTISIFWKKSYAAFFIAVVILLVSWLAGNGHPSIVPWLPGSQSMIFRHTFFDPSIRNFSIAWSLLYNIILCAIIITISTWFVKRHDLWIEPSDFHMEEHS